MSSNSPSNQRLPGAFSPVSPPYHLAAAQANGDNRAKPAIVHPQTPISPSNMSSSGPGNSSSASPTHASSNLSPSPSEPFTAPRSTQTSTTTALPTPASSIKGGISSTKDENLQTDSATSQTTSAAFTQGMAMVEDPAHARSDHDRQTNDAQMEGIQNAHDSADASSEPFYYVLAGSHPVSAPHPSQDLISMYGLDSMAASVARKDPVTGEKINKIRKSYETKIKILGLSGKAKPTSNPNEFLGLLDIPEDSWQATEVSTRDIKNGMTSTLEAKLDRALQIAPGKLPPEEADKWKSILSVDEPTKVKSNLNPKNKSGSAPAAPPSAKASSPPSSNPETSRPQRAGKKRRYDDASFEGYAEGNVDDGNSSQDESLASLSAKAKKRRKVSDSTEPLVTNTTSEVKKRKREDTNNDAQPPLATNTNSPVKKKIKITSGDIQPPLATNTTSPVKQNEVKNNKKDTQPSLAARTTSTVKKNKVKETKKDTQTSLATQTTSTVKKNKLKDTKKYAQSSPADGKAKKMIVKLKCGPRLGARLERL
ncbi:MAG: hypothetical protein M1820_002336 [Bogoriella megaspora]|nr:MAG: hypothetical protein M1820_002336 [Bogoriella megaspora]